MQLSALKVGYDGKSQELILYAGFGLQLSAISIRVQREKFYMLAKIFLACRTFLCYAMPI